jgi:hypothetical protein
MLRSREQSRGRGGSKLMRGAIAGSMIALAAWSVAGLEVHTARAAAVMARQAEMRYKVHFEGVGAEGVDNIWRGPFLGYTSGEITLRVEYLGAPADASHPVWRVRAMTFVAADDPARSLLAETEGTVDWRSGAMQLVGHVSDGWMRGATVDQVLHIDRIQLDGTGVLRLDVTTARR